MWLAQGKILQNYGFPCTLRAVLGLHKEISWLAWYCGKMYSGHPFSYGGLMLVSTCLFIKSKGIKRSS